MSVSTQYCTYVMDQLAPLGEITGRKMFGGFGIYGDGLFFALVADDMLYFKVDESNRADFLEEDMEPFQPNPDKPPMNYYQVPDYVLENQRLLFDWSSKALKVAENARK